MSNPHLPVEEFKDITTGEIWSYHRGIQNVAYRVLCRRTIWPGSSECRLGCRDAGDLILDMLLSNCYLLLSLNSLSCNLRFHGSLT